MSKILEAKLKFDPLVTRPWVVGDAAENAVVEGGGGGGLVDAGKEFMRPSGEVYKPRVITMKDGTEIRDVDLLKTAYDNRLPVLLYGPPGTGKTALADALFPNLQTLQGSGETEVADFVGSWVQETDGTYAWVDGPLLVAMEAGEPLLIDEIALIDPRTMAVVYGVMDGRNELVVTANPSRGVVKAQDGFYVVGAFNPNVPGAILSDALLSRFTIHLEILTDWSLARELKIPTKIVHVAKALNKKQTSGEIVAAPQIRELLAFKEVCDVFGEAVALANFVSTARSLDRAVYIQSIESTFGTKVDSFKIGGAK